jgi:hypothetical protein
MVVSDYRAGAGESTEARTVNSADDHTVFLDALTKLLEPEFVNHWPVNDVGGDGYKCLTSGPAETGTAYAFRKRRVMLFCRTGLRYFHPR